MRSPAVRYKCIKGATCIRCGRQYCIECHHIEAIQYGGKDSDENVVPLCKWCHKEWHNTYDPLRKECRAEWKAFLDAPHGAVAFALAKHTADGSFDAMGYTPSQSIELVKQAFSIYVGMKNTEDQDD